MARKRVLIIAMVLSSLLLCFQSFHAFAMATGEKSYLVVLKKESNLDNFIKAKGLEHKTPKKAKNFNIMSVDLTDEELQTLQNDSEIAYIVSLPELFVSGIPAVNGS